MSALNWLLRCAAFYAEKVKETLEQAAAESQLKMCLERLEKMLSSTKNRALIHIAKLEETCTWPPLPCPAATLCPWLLPGLPAGPGEMSLSPLPSPCPAPAALSLQLQAHPSSSPVAVTVSSLAPCHPLPPPLLGRGAELMQRLRELFLGVRRGPCSTGVPGTALRLSSAPASGQEPVPAPKRELLGDTQTLGLGSQRCAEFSSPQAPALADPLCHLPGFSACHCPSAERLPSLPSLLEHRGAIPCQAGGEPEQPQQLPAAKPG